MFDFYKRQLPVSRTVAVAFVASTWLATTPLQSQSTYDGDVTRAGHQQLALDALTYPTAAAKGGWLWLNPRGYVGLPHRIELGAGMSYYSHPAGGESALQPSIKWQAIRDTVHGFTLAAGAQSLVPLTRQGDGYGLTFLSLDHPLPQTARTAGAVSVGAYTLVHRSTESTDDRRGVILTAWEAVGPFRVNATWVSGRNFYGYRTGTVTWTARDGRWIGLGYSQGNATWHNAGPYLSTGRAF